jgi:peptide-methionine (S)-S-oxide reductase
LTYDTTKTDYSALLKMFWAHHDPRVSRSRQYMSAIFYYDDEQKRLAEETMAQEEKRKPGIKTLILPIGTFYEAEEYVLSP